MTASKKHSHWEDVHRKRASEEVSWFQSYPSLSLKWIEGAGTDLPDPIIDIGGGDSRLAECLLDKGFSNVSVLDISESGLKKAKDHMGEQKAERITWIVSDVLEFNPDPIYEVWHDRATFHFLTDPADQKEYASIAAQGVRHAGNVMIGCFSKNGPEKCSGLPVQQHDEKSLEETFGDYFDLLGFEYETHETPDGKEQEFIFARFRKK